MEVGGDDGMIFFNCTAEKSSRVASPARASTAIGEFIITKITYNIIKTFDVIRVKNFICGWLILLHLSLLSRAASLSANPVDGGSVYSCRRSVLAAKARRGFLEPPALRTARTLFAAAPPRKCLELVSMTSKSMLSSSDASLLLLLNGIWEDDEDVNTVWEALVKNEVNVSSSARGTETDEPAFCDVLTGAEIIQY